MSVKHWKLQTTPREAQSGSGAELLRAVVMNPAVFVTSQTLQPRPRCAPR